MEQPNAGARCNNCGTEIPEYPAAKLGDCEPAQLIRCHVCDYELTMVEVWSGPPISAEELEAQISTSIADARRRGVSTTEIMRILSDELEFTAELTRGGRRYCVKIIDLGPNENEFDLPSDHLLRELLTSRQHFA